MKELKVTVSDYDDLPDDLKADSSPYSQPFLIVKHGDELLTFEASNMEPEDATFWRDLKWVAPLLVKMYNLGRIDAITEALETLSDTTGS